MGSGGKPRSAGGKQGPAAHVSAKPLGNDGILNQNPIFEMDSNPCTAYKFRVSKKNNGGINCVKYSFFI
jgi:hypothetical protein